MCDRKAPQRKKRGRQQAVDPPFPVPIATITAVSATKNNWYYFTGELEADHVVVKHSGDIHLLYRMGFFGRGLMSQGKPDFYKGLPNVFIPEDNEEVSCYKVARRRMFLSHNQWKKSCDHDLTNAEAVNLEEDKQYDSDTEYVYERNNMQGLAMDEPMEYYHSGHVNTSTQRLEDTERIFKQAQGQSDRWSDSGEANDFFETHQSEKSQFKDTIYNEGTDWEGQTKAKASWDTDDEGDAGFWGDDNSSQNIETVPSVSKTLDKNDITQTAISKSIEISSDKADGSQAANSFRRTTNINENSNLQTCNAENQVDNEDFDSRNTLVKDSKKSDTNYDQSEHIHHHCDNEMKRSKDDTSVNAKFDKTETGINSADAIKSCNSSSESYNSLTVEVEPSSCSTCLDLNRNNSVIETERKNSDGKAVPIEFKAGKSDSLSCTGGTNTVPVQENITEAFDSAENKRINEPEKERLGCGMVDSENPAHDLTKKENSSDTVMKESTAEVIKSNLEDQDVSSQQLSGTATLSIIHPHCETEDTEADYLVIDDSDSEAEKGLKPVTQTSTIWKPVLKKDPYPIQEPLILTLEEEPLTLCDLWQRCNKLKQWFLPRYVAYHYFRSKGWVPKPGLLFGVDLILYKIGPPFYHGSYSVVVKTVHEGTFTEVEEYTNRKFSWTTFSGLHRVTEHVAKVLMICYVIFPTDLSEEERDSPDCVSKFKVKLQVINRWVSSQERGKEAEEMP